MESKSQNTSTLHVFTIDSQNQKQVGALTRIHELEVITSSYVDFVKSGIFEHLQKEVEAFRAFLILTLDPSSEKIQFAIASSDEVLNTGSIALPLPNKESSDTDNLEAIASMPKPSAVLYLAEENVLKALEKVTHLLVGQNKPYTTSQINPIILPTRIAEYTKSEYHKRRDSKRPEPRIDCS